MSVENIVTELPQSISIPSKNPTFSFTICTVVTSLPEYEEMRASFKNNGFTSSNSNFLYADNSDGNVFDAFSAYNIFLQKATAPYVILCHQDVLILEDGFQKLCELLDELNLNCPNWGLCGNAGAAEGGRLSIRITDPNTPNNSEGGPFPAKVISLDENFIVVRKDANLALSHDVSGFHLYGTDLCIIADFLGKTAYVINFHLLHKSGGKITEDFYDIRNHLILKYRRAMRSRWIETTTKKPFFISGMSAYYRVSLIVRAASWRLRHLFHKIIGSS